MSSSLLHPWSSDTPSWIAFKRLKRVVTLVNRKCDTVDGSYIGLENVESWTGRLVAGDGEETREGIASLFDAGDVLFGKLRPYLAKAWLATSAGRCTSELLVLRGTELEPRYLQFVLLTEPFIRSVDASTFGAKMPRADWKFIGQIFVPVPGRDRQRRIADFLDRKTKAIDELVRKKERLITLLQEKRQALITQAVTKGLDRKVPMKDSGVRWLGEIPAHWEVKRFKHACVLQTGHTPRKSEPSYWIDAECVIPWVSLNDTKSLEVSDFISDTAIRISETGMANSSAHLIAAGAVVFNRDGARVGLAAIITKPMAVSQHMIAWVCGPSMNNYYLLQVLYAMTEEIYRITIGSTIPTIGMPDVRQMTAPIPPIDEQVSIASFLKQARQETGESLEKLTDQISKLREYRQALITAAVTGQIDVTEEAAA